MLVDYIPLFLVLGFAVIFALATVLSSKIFGPQRPNPEKETTYESGVQPYGTTHERVSVKYYLVAMLFIIFDLEVIFVYPWAVQFKKLYLDPSVGVTAFWAMIIFLVVFEIGYLYVYKKGGFRWD